MQRQLLRLVQVEQYYLIQMVMQWIMSQAVVQILTLLSLCLVVQMLRHVTMMQMQQQMMVVVSIQLSVGMEHLSVIQRIAQSHHLRLYTQDLVQLVITVWRLCLSHMLQLLASSLMQKVHSYMVQVVVLLKKQALLYLQVVIL